MNVLTVIAYFAVVQSFETRLLKYFILMKITLLPSKKDIQPLISAFEHKIK